MAEELAFDGVADGALVAKFVELTDVVQNRGRQQQINVELRVVDSDLPREAAQADDVLEQAAEISVVHHFRRGSAFVFRGDGGVRNDGGRELFQPGIRDRARIFQKLGVELADVFFGVGKKVSQVDLLGFREPKLLQRELRLVAVNLDTRVYLDEIVAADVLRRDVELIPHTSFDGAAAIAELEAQVGLALAGVANLFFVNEEKSSDALFGV